MVRLAVTSMVALRRGCHGVKGKEESVERSVVEKDCMLGKGGNMKNAGSGVDIEI